MGFVGGAWRWANNDYVSTGLYDLTEKLEYDLTEKLKYDLTVKSKYDSTEMLKKDFNSIQISQKRSSHKFSKI